MICHSFITLLFFHFTILRHLECFSLGKNDPLVVQVLIKTETEHHKIKRKKKQEEIFYQCKADANIQGSIPQ